MSNCVSVYSDVVFTPDMVDVGRLWRDVQEAPDVPPALVEDGKEELYFFSWFLKGALAWEDDNLVWSPGTGESGHTWRDLKGTCHILGRYVVAETAQIKLFLQDTDAPTEPGWTTFKLKGE